MSKMAASKQASRPEHAAARAQGLFDIGAAAAHSGVSAKMIRYYERIGLLPAAVRSFGNYRLYGEAELHRLRFILRARRLGFAMKQIAALLALWDDPHRASSEVRTLARAHAADLGEKIAQMQAMVRTLESLANRCHGDDRPTCPILDDLAAQPAQRHRQRPRKQRSDVHATR